MAKESNDLAKLPNIGKVLTEKLQLAGIATASELKATGAEDAFARILAIDKDACIDMLYAIEGAIEGIRWHHLDKARKGELLDFFRSVSKG